MNLDIQYAFGGDEQAPLVSRVVRFPFNPDQDIMMQLLLRTDAVIRDVWEVQDAALAILDDVLQPSTSRGQALDTAVACQEFVCCRVMHQSIPTTGSSAAFVRMQALFQRFPAIAHAFGVEVVERVRNAMDSSWQKLLHLQALATASAASAASAAEASADSDASAEAASADADDAASKDATMS
jgi:hypothetical protein